MGIFDRFRKKREEFPEVRESVLPSELRELKERISAGEVHASAHALGIPQAREAEKPVPKQEELSFPPIGLDVELKPKELQTPEGERKTELEHKIEMILTKLDLLNERVKVIEEKLERKGII